MELFSEAGWPVFPTTLFGTMTVAVSVWLSVRPERRFVPLIIALAALTVCTALMGSCVGLLGVVKAAQNAAAEDVRTIVLACLTQALSSVLVAFALITVAGLGTAAGALRHALARS